MQSGARCGCFSCRSCPLVAAAVSLAAEVAVLNRTLLCQWLPCVVKVAATVTMAT